MDNFTTGRNILMGKLFWPVRMIVGFFVHRSVRAIHPEWILSPY